ncbi:MAG TPA: DUF2147 domain-containing protein [Hanamia sp.]|nr:DUF2147 domain-containing protein [Hanamia sp.]
MKNIIAVLLLSLLVPIAGNAQKDPDAILGKWMTTDNRLTIEVYKQNEDFKAKILWFKDENDQVMNERLDEKNPDKTLRLRKWIGMDVLRNLHYNAEKNEWTDGIIYDAKHGRDWDSMAWIDEDHLLKVKGYWVFKFICETLTFKKL